MNIWINRHYETVMCSIKRLVIVDFIPQSILISLGAIFCSSINNPVDICHSFKANSNVNYIMYKLLMFYSLTLERM